MWHDGGRQVFLEPPRNSDIVRVEVSSRQGPDEGSKVGPAHWEVAGEDLEEALVELNLNESNEGCRYVLLDRCLCLEAGVHLVFFLQERCKLEHSWEAA